MVNTSVKINLINLFDAVFLIIEESLNLIFLPCIHSFSTTDPLTTQFNFHTSYFVESLRIFPANIIIISKIIYCNELV